MGNNYKTEQYLNKHFLTPKQLKLFKYCSDVRLYRMERIYKKISSPCKSNNNSKGGSLMAKKKKEIKQWDEAVDDLENYETQDGFIDINDENNPNSVYLFHNTKSGINLKVDADGANEAMRLFDLSNFQNRNDWKIFVEIGTQPVNN